MYYLILNENNPELQELFPQGIPTDSENPEEFVEVYDEFGEFVDIEMAYNVNIRGLTQEEELRLFQNYAATNNANLVRGAFQMLDDLKICSDQVEKVVWRQAQPVLVR
jgi:hypothetical protein